MNKKSTKNLITENDYWKIIEESLNNSIEKQYEYLWKIFENKTKEQLIGFCYHGTELYRKAYTSKLWAAVYIVRGGCGDDSFHYFRCWLATRNKKVYYDALKNPDSLIYEFKKYKYRDDILRDHIRITVDEYYKQIHPEGIELSEIIEEEYKEVFETKGEMEMEEILEFNWEENDAESLKKLCPNIYNEYWAKPLKNKTYAESNDTPQI